MKPKKSAFNSNNNNNHHHHHNHQRQIKTMNNNNNNNNNSSKDSKGNVKDANEDKLVEALENDKDLNSGFGDYLRTPEAVEMMKLFVFANSVMLILTMAWPNIQEQYYWLMQWIESLKSESS